MTLNSASANSGYEIVFTVSDYHDGPRSGVANFRGSPHFYQAVFDDNADDYGDVYLLTPISQETLEAALQDWEIFLRWRAAFNSGKVGRDSHPALPQDKTKFEETSRELNGEVASKRDQAFRVRGRFETFEKSGRPRDAFTSWRVKWNEPSH
jgi:hypothetical protein